MGLFNKPEKVNVVEDYGNGVLYFNVVDKEFAKELALYLKDHSNRHVTKIIPNDYSAYPDGYIVIVEKV